MVKTFEADLTFLYAMLAFVTEEALAVGFSPEQTQKIELALEEALVNIIEHGYSSEKGFIEISCEKHKPSGITITIKDTGTPYNPLNAPKPPEKKVSIDHRSVGGYGIHFIVTLMDEVNYRYDNGNVLTLTKRL